MKKPPKRANWHRGAKSKRSTVKTHARNLDLCQRFQERYRQGGTIQEVAREVGVATRTAYRWALTVQMAAAEFLRREGWNEAKIMLQWIAQAKRSRGHVLNGALRELGTILDVYPARKEPALPQSPVTVIFNADLSQYEGEEYAPRTLELRPGFQIEPARDAGGRTPKGAIPGGSLRDAKKSGREKE
jgi:hypothetical protein